MNSRIYIFTAPVRSGKTSAVMDWLKDRNDAGGFLTPDKDGLRMLYDICEKAYQPFETNEEDGQEVISIGRFLFLEQGFEAGKKLMRNAIDQPVAWFIADEAGKLEVEMEQGFEPELSSLIKHYQQANQSGKLLLLIRDSLLDKAIVKYNLQGATIFTGKFPSL